MRSFNAPSSTCSSRLVTDVKVASMPFTVISLLSKASSVVMKRKTVESASVRILLSLMMSCCYGDVVQPGIFHDQVCTDLGTSPHVKPLCDCRRQHNVSSFSDFCRPVADGLRVYHVIGECIQGAADPSYYLGQVFDRDQFVKSFEYLCPKYEDIQTDVQTCWDSRTTTAASECDGNFYNSLNITDTFYRKSACRLTDDLRLCYWTKLNCPALDRHFISKLSEAYLSPTCLQHSNVSVSEKCDDMADQVYPKHKGGNLTRCLAAVDVRKECFTFESLESTHIWDQFVFSGFNIQKYFKFSRLFCELDAEKCILGPDAYERHEDCKEKHFHSLYELYMAALPTGSEQKETFSADDICRIFDQSFRCFSNIHGLSDICKRTFFAYLCSASPGKCHCPLEEARMSFSFNSFSKYTLSNWCITGLIFKLFV